MWGLLAATIATSAVDSINPFGITQQFVLQGMVKKPSHIWFFILPTGITNGIFGFLAYFGLVVFIQRFWQEFLTRFGAAFYLLGLAAGVFLLGLAAWLAFRKQPESGDTSRQNTAKAAKNIRGVTPWALVVLGVGATISELTTALPYFAFLAILLQYQLPFWQLALILVLYNLIYMLPLMLMYVLYRTAQKQFDRLYAVLRQGVAKAARVLAPLVAAGVGGALLLVVLPKIV